MRLNISGVDFCAIRTFARLALIFAFGGILSACATEKPSETQVTMLDLEKQSYEPITRLAFVKSDEKSGHILIVRSMKTEPATTEVATIETAAGDVREKLVEH